MNKFVFLITCFNEETGVIKTLKTIYSQSYENWRIIIRNDMSTDNTTNNKPTAVITIFIYISLC